MKTSRERHPSEERSETEDPAFRVGPADDQYERAADLAAGRALQRLADAGALGASGRTGDTVRRQPAEVGLAGGTPASDTSQRIGSAQGGGDRLPPDLRRSMETAFGGTDFGRVRLHSGPEAADLNGRLGASAFTVGRDIFLGAGTPSLDSQEGQRLLAHELAHTTQPTVTAQRKLMAGLKPGDFFDRLEDLKARSLTDHIPSTGLGRFDAEFIPNPDKPAKSRLIVTVRPYFEFLQKVEGGAAIAGGWAPDAERDFVAEFTSQSERNWSHRNIFVCTKPGYEGLIANVEIKVEPTKDVKKAHFHHRVQKSKGMSTGIGREQVADRSQINVGNFGEADKTVRPHDSDSTRSCIAEHDEMRLRKLIDAHQVNPIRFTGDKRAQIDDDSKKKLDAFVQAAHDTERPGSVPIPLVVLGKRNSRESKGGRDQARAMVVKTYLDGKGIKNTPCETKLFDDVVDDQKAVYEAKKSKQARQGEKAKYDELAGRQRHREVELTVKENFDWAGDPYSILAHEFGHMLGNPDEYFDYGSEAIRDAKVRQLQSTGKQEDLLRAQEIATKKPSGNDSHSQVQERFGALAEGSDTTIPEFGPKTSSIMSAGADVLPVHYAPLWEALSLITSDAIAKEHWQIRPAT
jgi:hypothetical protein